MNNLIDNLVNDNNDNIIQELLECKPMQYIEQDLTVITNKLTDQINLEDILHVANVHDEGDISSQIMDIVNTNGVAASKSIIGTKVVDPGKIGIINHNGRIEIVGTGRWLILNPRASWKEVKTLTENIIYETLSVVRINKGHIGLATENGKSVVLGEGVHVRNSRLFNYVESKDINQEYIHHGTIHILMIPQGKYGLVVENNVPKILKSGRYVIDSNYFSYAGSVDENAEYIRHQTIHIIRIPKSQIGLVTYNNKPVLLYEGTYVYNTQLIKLDDKKRVNDDLIKHSTITRFRIKNGEIGTAWHNNIPIFIEKPGIYEVDSLNFVFEKSIPAIEKKIVLGSKMRIIVCEGEVGISYVNGKLEILQPNTHIFDTTRRIFVCFLSTKQQVIQLSETEDFEVDNKGRPKQKEYILKCDTKDFVAVGIKATVFYKISNPALALVTVGDQAAITKLIEETSTATLQGIMRSSALNQVAQSTSVHVKKDAKNSLDQINPFNQPTNTGLFFDKVHDDFITRLHDTFVKLYGLEISNIRIESFKIINKELEDSISKQAIITAQTENKLANLEGQREIATAEQERDANVLRIKAQAEALKLETDTAAKNNAMILEAEAKARALKIGAQAEADALLLKAQAEAKAIELRAAAEKKRAQELSSNKLGEQLALLNVQSDMVTKSLHGVQKIIYLPSDSKMSSVPSQLFSALGPALGMNDK
jgi:regulator of protease activity HflC (stomatin/prohibitin superfamily)